MSGGNSSLAEILLCNSSGKSEAETRATIIVAAIAVIGQILLLLLKMPAVKALLVPGQSTKTKQRREVRKLIEELSPKMERLGELLQSQTSGSEKDARSASPKLEAISSK